MILNIEPIPKGRPRISRGGHAFTPAKTRQFENELKSLFKKQYSGSPLEEPLCVSVCFYITRPKSVKRLHPAVKADIDNYLKAVLDAGNEILWSDDSIICEVNVEKKYAAVGSIVLNVWPIDHSAMEEID